MPRAKQTNRHPLASSFGDCPACHGRGRILGYDYAIGDYDLTADSEECDACSGTRTVRVGLSGDALRYADCAIWRLGITPARTRRHLEYDVIKVEVGDTSANVTIGCPLFALTPGEHMGTPKTTLDTVAKRAVAHSPKMPHAVKVSQIWDWHCTHGVGSDVTFKLTITADDVAAYEARS